MNETTQQKFHKIAQFNGSGKLFMMSMFNTLFWEKTIQRWRKEGAPEDIVPAIDSYLYGPTLRQNEYFHLDRMQMMSEVRSGMLYTEGEHWKDFPPRSSLVPIIPLFEPEILAQDERTITLRAASGQVGKIMRAEGYEGVMPQFLERPVKDRATWNDYKRRLDPNTPQRWPADWPAYVKQCNSRDYPLGIYAGSFFGFLREWMGLEPLLYGFYDDPALIEEMMDTMLNLVTVSATRVLKDIKPDFAMIWEDMAYKNGAMISPAMFRKFMMPRYRKVVDLLHSHDVNVILVDTDGNVGQLIPLWIECGVNATWPLEVAAGNDAVQIRKQYGKDFIPMGNLDKQALAKGKNEIREEIMKKAPFMLEHGGYFASADHMIPPDVSWENYCYYLDTLREVSGQPRIFGK